MSGQIEVSVYKLTIPEKINSVISNITFNIRQIEEYKLDYIKKFPEKISETSLIEKNIITLKKHEKAQQWDSLQTSVQDFRREYFKKIAEFPLKGEIAKIKTIQSQLNVSKRGEYELWQSNLKDFIEKIEQYAQAVQHYNTTPEKNVNEAVFTLRSRVSANYYLTLLEKLQNKVSMINDTSSEVIELKRSLNEIESWNYLDTFSDFCESIYHYTKDMQELLNDKITYNYSLNERIRNGERAEFINQAAEDVWEAIKMNNYQAFKKRFISEEDYENHYGLDNYNKKVLEAESQFKDLIKMVRNEKIDLQLCKRAPSTYFMGRHFQDKVYVKLTGLQQTIRHDIFLPFIFNKINYVIIVEDAWIRDNSELRYISAPVLKKL